MSRWPYVGFVPIIVAALFALSGCAASHTKRHGLAAEVDSVCGGAAWRQRNALSAGVLISREGRPDMRGEMLYDIRGNRIVVQFPSNGGGIESFGFDGHTLWADRPYDSDSDCADWPMLVQWTAWVAVPHRLTEASLRVREVQPVSMAGATYRVAELERPADGPGICALYIEPGGLRPRGGVPVLPSNVNPDAMPSEYGFAYEKFEVCNDVLIPTRWSIWPWQARDGISAVGPVASITLRAPRFVDPDPSLFESPAKTRRGAKVVKVQRFDVPVAASDDRRRRSS